MKKLSRKTNNILAGVLSLALLLGVFAAVPEIKAYADEDTEVAAVEPRLTTPYSFSVKTREPFRTTYKNPNSQNDLKIYINAQPNSGRVLVEVYANENWSGNPNPYRYFYAGESGIQMTATIPKGETYSVQVSTESKSYITGTLKITS